MRSKSHTLVVWSLVLVSLTLVLTACGSRENEPQGSASNGKSAASQPPAAAPAQAMINAAEFLTKADAEAVFGKPVDQPAPPTVGAASSNVTYITSDSIAVNVYVRSGASQQEFDGAQAKSTAAPVDGLSVKAFLSGKNADQLNVFKNGYWFIITMHNGGNQSVELAKKMAEKILARVP